MASPQSPLQSLRRRIHRWGGALLLLDPDDYARKVAGIYDGNPWEGAPFAYGHAVWWKERVIAVSRPLLRLPVLIHEMGHVFADLHPPSFSDEYAWFGWEYALAQAVGIEEETWRADNKDYVVGDLIDFGKLSRAQQDEILVERVKEARTHGLLDARNRPRALR